MDKKELKMCLKIHGYQSSDDSSDEGSSSDSESECARIYEANKPAPIPIDPSKDKIIAIGAAKSRKTTVAVSSDSDSSTRKLSKSQKKRRRKKRKKLAQCHQKAANHSVPQDSFDYNNYVDNDDDGTLYFAAKQKECVDSLIQQSEENISFLQESEVYVSSNEKMHLFDENKDNTEERNLNNQHLLFSVQENLLTDANIQSFVLADCTGDESTNSTEETNVNDDLNKDHLPFFAQENVIEDVHIKDSDILNSTIEPIVSNDLYRHSIDVSKYDLELAIKETEEIIGTLVEEVINYVDKEQVESLLDISSFKQQNEVECNSVVDNIEDVDVPNGNLATSIIGGKEASSNICDNVSVCDNSADTQMEKKPKRRRRKKKKKTLEILNDNVNLNVKQDEAPSFKEEKEVDKPTTSQGLEASNCTDAQVDDKIEPKKKTKKKRKRNRGKEHTESSNVTPPHSNPTKPSQGMQVNETKQKTEEFEKDNADNSQSDKVKNVAKSTDKTNANNKAESHDSSAKILKYVDDIDCLIRAQSSAASAVTVFLQIFGELMSFIQSNFTNAAAIISKLTVAKHKIESLGIPFFNCYLAIYVFMVKLAFSFENYVTYKEKMNMDCKEYSFHVDSMVLETVGPKNYASDFFMANHEIYKLIYDLLNLALVSFVEKIVETLNTEKEDLVFLCNDVVKVEISRNHVVPYMEKVAQVIKKRRKSIKYSNRLKDERYIFLTTTEPESFKSGKEL